MSASIFTRRQAIAEDWRDMILEAMLQQHDRMVIAPTHPEAAEMAEMIDRLIDRNLPEWKLDIQKRVGITHIGVGIPFPPEVVADRLEAMFIERLNMVLPMPYRAKDLDGRGRWRDCFEVNWML